MKKAFVLTLMFAICYAQGIAQNRSKIQDIGPLKRKLAEAKDDSSRVLILAEPSYDYNNKNVDSTILLAQQAYQLAHRIGFRRGEAKCLNVLGNGYENRGDLPRALSLQFEAWQIAKDIKDQFLVLSCLTDIGNVFFDLSDHPRAVIFFKEAAKINRLVHNFDQQAIIAVNLGELYMAENKLDSASAFLQPIYNQTLHSRLWHPVLLMFFGDLQFRLGKKELAFDFLHKSIEMFKQNQDRYSQSDACRIIAGFYKTTNQPDSGIYYANEALKNAQAIGYKTSILAASKILAELYEQKKDIGKAHQFLKLELFTTDELYGAKKVQELQKIIADQQEIQRKDEAEQVANQNRLRYYLLSGLVFVLLVIASILWYGNSRRRKANRVLEKTLNDLKTTQNQLVQSAKMASLGELTAGIAHEIQNPLNFVNNFSDVSVELLAELKEEEEKGNKEDVIAIADDLTQNLEKIRHHGKRADAIVKGMLQHSRVSSGQKEPTDINGLANEYLRLAYHGLRSKDKEFNAELITHFDEKLPKVSVIPQDIGRVLINLFGNAFYAVNQKAKTAGPDYKPIVELSTERQNGSVIVSVKDNGTGIPENIREKIMQPFFTTKPTGEGTGLGLSLSYDIVVKGHGGRIDLHTKEGEFTEFVVTLPLS